MWIIIAIAHGYSAWGPFETTTEAENYAVKWLSDFRCHVVKLHTPPQEVINA